MEEVRIGNHIYYIDRTQKILLTKTEYLEGRERYAKELAKKLANQNG